MNAEDSSVYVLVLHATTDADAAAQMVDVARECALNKRVDHPVLLVHFPHKIVTARFNTATKRYGIAESTPRGEGQETIAEKVQAVLFEGEEREGVTRFTISDDDKGRDALTAPKAGKPK
jgi:hypothetical protein